MDAVFYASPQDVAYALKDSDHDCPEEYVSTLLQVAVRDTPFTDKMIKDFHQRVRVVSGVKHTIADVLRVLRALKGSEAIVTFDPHQSPILWAFTCSTAAHRRAEQRAEWASWLVRVYRRAAQASGK